MMGAKAIRGIQAVLVLAGAIAAWILVPHEVLLPIAVAALAISVGGVFAIRAYMRRLHAAGTLGEPGRQALLTEAGVTLALVGIVAFLVLVLEYAD